MSEDEKTAIRSHVAKSTERLEELNRQAALQSGSKSETEISLSDSRRQYAERLIFKLLDTADGLEQGRPYQVTRFYPLVRLCNDQSGHDFILRILVRVRDEVVASGVSPLMPLDEKLGWLNEAIRRFVLAGSEKGIEWQGAVRKDCADLYEVLRNLQPGWKRIWIHASRRRAVDRELLLAEWALRGYPEGVIALFLTSYEGYRYHLLPDAAERLRWVAHLWCSYIFNRMLDGFVAERQGQPPPPRVKRPLSVWQLRQQRSAQFGALRKAAVTSEGFVVPTVPLGFPSEPPPAFELSAETVAQLDALSRSLQEDDERDDLDDAVEEKLARAHYHLVKAWRIFRSNGDLGQVATRLKGAKNRYCEAWLYRNGQPVTDTDTRDYLMDRFAEQAPRCLLRKATVLEEKLTELFYCQTDNDQQGLGQFVPSEIRRSELAACLTETLALYEQLRNGTELSLFRWERENDFVPGQWVLTLANLPIGCNEQGLDLRCQHATPFQVVVIEEKGVVLRRGGTADLQRLFIDSLFLWPTAVKEEVASPIEKRRAWFDPRPQLRQVPLELPQIIGIGKSIDYACNFKAALYETCPCCGYPIIDTLSKKSSGDWGECEPDDPCLICAWIDGGPRPGIRDRDSFYYTLAEVRKNFLAYGSMFGPDDGKDFDDSQLTAAKELKSSLCDVFDAMVGERNHGTLFLLWWQAEALRHRLLADKSCQREELQPGVWIEGLIDKECLLVAVYRSHVCDSIILRLRNQHGINRESTWGWGKLLPRPPIDIWTPFFARRTWFERYPEFLRGQVPCPCCGYPTLTARGVGECCPLCAWEDDGQDDHNADQVLGGPNEDYSLTEARKNFSEMFSMFRFKGKTLGSTERPDNNLSKIQLMKLYDPLITVETPHEADELWSRIDAVRR